MMKMYGGALAALMIVACSSSDDADTDTKTPDQGSGCSNITGNYTVQVTPVEGGTCAPGKGSTISISITKSGDALALNFPIVEGGCPAELDVATCRMTALCKIVENGQNQALFNFDYTFTGTTFTGSLTGSLNPPIVPESCTANAKHSGSRI